MSFRISNLIHPVGNDLCVVFIATSFCAHGWFVDWHIRTQMILIKLVPIRHHVRVNCCNSLALDLASLNQFNVYVVHIS